MEKKKLGLYIHIPFCERKCNYCDFLSASPASPEMLQYYMASIEEDLRQEAHKISNLYIIDTIYIGGGTPSLIPSELMEHLCETVKKEFILDEDYEWTIECNPNSVTQEKLETYIKAGINRISIGLQAKQDHLLHDLGRIHSFSQFEHSIALIKESGFHNINIDIMYGLPNQKLSEWVSTVDYVLELKPDHLSAYSLILEEGTPFFQFYSEQRDALPSEDQLSKMEDYLFEQTRKSGYKRYEISNFAIPGKESRHNLRYWRLQDYLGVGLGASSCFLGNPGIRRSKNVSRNEYLEGHYSGEVIITEKRSFMEEYSFLGLRMLEEGIDLVHFESLFDLKYYDVFDKDTIDKRIEQGLLEERKTTSGHKLRLTKRGAEVANLVMSDFLLPDPNPLLE